MIKGLRDLGNKNVIREGRGMNGSKSKINSDKEGNAKKKVKLSQNAVSTKG